MQQLNLYPGYPVCVKFLETKPPVGRYIRLQPVVRGEYFNPCVEKLHALLESQLKNYQVLTLGDVFTILDPVCEFLSVKEILVCFSRCSNASSLSASDN